MKQIPSNDPDRKVLSLKTGEKLDINAAHQKYGNDALNYIESYTPEEFDRKVEELLGPQQAKPVPFEGETHENLDLDAINQRLRDAVNGGAFPGAGQTHARANGSEQKAEAEALGGLKATTAAELLKTKAPKRKWVVEDWIPDNTVTLFAGDGGIGKSVLAAQLLWACSTDREWLGRPVKKCPVLYVSCEDDTDEIHFRLEKLLDHEPCATGLENFHIIDLVGEINSEIATFQHEKLVLTELYSKIEAYVQTHKPGLLALDASADMFGGDEISKRQVRAFIRALNGLARKHSCAIILIAHPSKSGMKDGTGYSGNVAWNGSVRARLYFEAAKPKNASDKDSDDDTEDDDDRRVLKLPKSNRSRAGQKIYVRWEDGRFVLDSANGRPSIEQGIEDEALFLKILDKVTAEGRNACATTGQSYAPKAFAEHPLGKGVSRERFRQAMENLLGAGKIINQPEGPPSRRRWKLVRVSQ